MGVGVPDFGTVGTGMHCQNGVPWSALSEVLALPAWQGQRNAGSPLE